MKISAVQNYIQSKIDTILVLAILFYLFRAAIPFSKYPFLFFYSIVFLYSVSYDFRNLGRRLKSFLKDYYLFHVLSLFLFIAFLVSSKLYLIAFKDLVNSFILISFLFFMGTLIKTKEELRTFLNTIEKTLIIFGFFLSFILLNNTFLQKNGSSEDEVSFIISNDYNFISLFFFYGFIAAFIRLLNADKLLEKVIYNILLITYSFGIIFSGSRRAMIVYFILIIIFYIFLGFLFVYKKSLCGKYFRNSVSYFIMMIFFILLSWFLIFKTSYLFKDRVLQAIGTEDVNLTKRKLTFLVDRYTKLFNSDVRFNELYERIWIGDYDKALNPDTGWGVRRHKTVFPLTGKNSEIVPPNAYGYLIDSTSNTDTWNGDAYSYTSIGDSAVNTDYTLKASVYCYVSDEFNATWVKLTSEGSGITECNYDMNNKGTWQKLNMTVNGVKGSVAAFIYISKKGVTDFSTLKGYVVFAYPQFEISTAAVDTVLSSSQNTSLKYLLYNYPSFSCFKFQNYPHVSTANLYSAINITALNSQINNDPILEWTSKFISEDTTYYAYKANIEIDSVSNPLFNDRLIRWNFAFQIFSKEFSIPNKLFGNGFDFLNWFGFKFLNDKRAVDYPHNPFLSIILYSGVIGLIFYLILITKVFYYYYRYHREYLVVSIIFLVTFFFSFFSAGSPFDPPVMGFFSILPFFINRINRNAQ